jgi:hypothetical protein
MRLSADSCQAAESLASTCVGDLNNLLLFFDLCRLQPYPIRYDAPSSSKRVGRPRTERVRLDRVRGDK